MATTSGTYTTQNDLLLNNLLNFYSVTNTDGSFNPNNQLDKMLKIISGESKISLRIVDWFEPIMRRSFIHCTRLANVGSKFMTIISSSLRRILRNGLTPSVDGTVLACLTKMVHLSRRQLVS